MFAPGQLGDPRGFGTDTCSSDENRLRNLVLIQLSCTRFPTVRKSIIATCSWWPIPFFVILGHRRVVTLEVAKRFYRIARIVFNQIVTSELSGLLDPYVQTGQRVNEVGTLFQQLTQGICWAIPHDFITQERSSVLYCHLGYLSQHTCHLKN